MAYDKIIPIRRRLDHCMGYILNPDKTALAAAMNYISDAEKTTLGTVAFTSAINCTLETAYQDMMQTKRRWGKAGGVLGYHLIHSYAPGEVTPAQAHELGVAFARRLLGARYEAVVSTHLDREHLHCHILFNSVSFVDGKKYQNTFKDYFQDIRGTSNAVSAESGLSVIVPEIKGKHYAEWNAEKQGTATVRGLVRQDIDAAVAGAFTYQSFWRFLTRMGYEVKSGKHIAIKPPGGARFIRLASLGDSYTEDAIKVRVAAGRVKTAQPRPAQQLVAKRYRIRRKPMRRRRLRGFRALYVHYLYLLGKRSAPRARKPPVSFAVRQEVTKLHRYQQQFRFLQTYHIDTAQQLSMLGDALQAEIDALTEQRKELYRKQRQGMDAATELSGVREQLRALRRKLKTCNQIAEDIPRIQAQSKEAYQTPQQRKEEVKQYGRQR